MLEPDLFAYSQSSITAMPALTPSPSQALPNTKTRKNDYLGIRTPFLISGKDSLKNYATARREICQMFYTSSKTFNRARLVTLVTTRFSWLNCALRGDKAVHWVSRGQQ